MSIEDIEPKTAEADAQVDMVQGAARYQGVAAGAIVVRTVELKNGGRVILFSSGDKVIELPGQPTKTEKPDGRIVVAQVDGRVSESRIKRLIPLEEKPPQRRQWRRGACWKVTFQLCRAAVRNGWQTLHFGGGFLSRAQMAR